MANDTTNVSSVLEKKWVQRLLGWGGIASTSLWVLFVVFPFLPIGNDLRAAIGLEQDRYALVAILAAFCIPAASVLIFGLSILWVKSPSARIASVRSQLLGVKSYFSVALTVLTVLSLFNYTDVSGTTQERLDESVKVGMDMLAYSLFTAAIFSVIFFVSSHVLHLAEADDNT